jgi:hypothetical protein
MPDKKPKPKTYTPDWHVDTNPQENTDYGNQHSPKSDPHGWDAPPA